jgi:hypothetical protein
MAWWPVGVGGGMQVGGQAAVTSLSKLRSLETLAINGCRGMSEASIRQLKQDLPCLKHVRSL